MSKLIKSVRDDVLKQNEDGVAIKSAENDVSIKSAENDVPIKSGKNDVPIKSAEYDVPVKSAENEMRSSGVDYAPELWFVECWLGRVHFRFQPEGFSHSNSGLSL